MRQYQRHEHQEETESGAEMEAEEDEVNEKELYRDGDTPRGPPVEVIRMGVGGVHPPEENANLPYFTLEHAHLLLWGVYGYFPHHNYGSHLDGRVADGAI